VAASILNGKNLGMVMVLAIIAGAFALTFLKGCDETTARDVQPVKLGGKTFFLEVAADEPTRMKGLGQRTVIDENGGMLFVFSSAQDPARGGFVMRDCPVDIDIIYLDKNGYVVTMHQMKKEDPRGTYPDEGNVGDLDNEKYEKRLKRYPARYPYQFAIELAGGTLPTLKVKEGDKIELPVDKLKARAR
jgi:uncharacterized membrane protein (UPF0127 family)